MHAHSAGYSSNGRRLECASRGLCGYAQARGEWTVRDRWRSSAAPGCAREMSGGYSGTDVGARCDWRFAPADAGQGHVRGGSKFRWTAGSYLCPPLVYTRTFLTLRVGLVHGPQVVMWTCTDLKYNARFSYNATDHSMCTSNGSGASEPPRCLVAEGATTTPEEHAEWLWNTFAGSALVRCTEGGRLPDARS